MRELSPQYNSNEVEDHIYRLWEKSGFFNPDKLPKPHALNPKPFTIIMPPPNANGALHIGHAVFVTLQDIMIRFERMRGKRSLWVPGADHAGIETEYVYKKKLEKEGRRWNEIPRDQLYREIYEFTQTNKIVMENQLRKLGASCDWSREKFTLDPDIVEKVQSTFVKMYRDGLIYRGLRVVNWSIKDQTALSDLEIEYREQKDPLYYIKYGPLVLATVRPETKFGDTAVAVHPKDKRYQKYIGRELEIETLLGPVKIKVISDEAVDPEFGTGVVKVTPAHDPADFEIGLRHNLEVRQVIDRYGRLNEKTGPYAGMKVDEARKRVAEDMKAKGLIIKVDEDYVHSVAFAKRSGGAIEPMVLPQWFVKVAPLKDAAVKSVRSGKIKFVPKRFEKVFFHWMKNLRDWNISRQIIWGIRIPAWFCSCSESAKKILVQEKAPEGICPECGENFRQDNDVLDTWFSSGQWPFLALGYPNGKDFKTFYPTDVMETGWDILFFWVARMIMLGIYRTGKPPFKTVYLHGLVRDKDRQKMSKSKGNVIDPLGVAKEYGTDAVRMALVVGNLPGNDIIISEEKIRGYRNFANKIWNATRFVLQNTNSKVKIQGVKFSSKDKTEIKKLKNLTRDTTRDIENHRFHHAAERLYHFFWHYYADKIIEHMKPRLKSEKKSERESAQALLLEFHSTLIKLLHPFMPFVTEEAWKHLPLKNKKLLLAERWPMDKPRS